MIPAALSAPLTSIAVPSAGGPSGGEAGVCLLLLTKPDKSQRLSSDPRGSWRHLSDLLHALNPRALPQSLRA